MQKRGLGGGLVYTAKKQNVEVETSAGQTSSIESFSKSETWRSEPSIMLKNTP